MTHTPTDTRLQISPAIERLMAFVGKPLPLPADMDLWRAGRARRSPAPTGASSPASASPGASIAARGCNRAAD